MPKKALLVSSSQLYLMLIDWMPSKNSLIRYAASPISRACRSLTDLIMGYSHTWSARVPAGEEGGSAGE